MVRDDTILVKDNRIWNKIEEIASKRPHSEPISDNIYVKTKVKDLMMFYSKNIPRENTRYICLVEITVDL